MALAKIEAAFGISPFDDTALATGSNWVDITSYTREVTYKTSTRSDLFGVFVGGSATFVFSALDRELDPSYSGSTYVGEIVARVPIRIIGVHSSTEYVQWYGYADEWKPGYDGLDAVTILTAYDVLSALSSFDLDELTNESYANDNCGARLDRICDLWGFPSAYRDFDKGTQLIATTFGTNALRHGQLVALSDGGFLYAQYDGTLTFDGMHALTTTRQTTSQATFTGYLADPPPSRTGVGKTFRNLVRIGGAGVTTAETDNVGTNGLPVAYQRLDLLMAFQGRADSLADFYAELYGTETPYTEAASFVVAASSNTTYDSAHFTRKLRDRVTLSITPPGPGSAITDELFIDGVAGRITPERWEIRYKFSSADSYDNNLLSQPGDWMIVDDADMGKVGTGRVSY